MTRTLVSTLLCLSTVLVSGQQPGRKPAGGTEQLAIVTAMPDQKELKLGQDLGVTLTIKAGNLGAYIPNHFTDWEDTCQAGFVVDLYTLKGDRASTNPKAADPSTSVGMTTVFADADVLHQTGSYAQIW